MKFIILFFGILVLLQTQVFAEHRIIESEIHKIADAGYTIEVIWFEDIEVSGKIIVRDSNNNIILDQMLKYPPSTTDVKVFSNKTGGTFVFLRVAGESGAGSHLYKYDVTKNKVFLFEANARDIKFEDLDEDGWPEINLVYSRHNNHMSRGYAPDINRFYSWILDEPNPVSKSSLREIFEDRYLTSRYNLLGSLDVAESRLVQAAADALTSNEKSLICELKQELHEGKYGQDLIIFYKTAEYEPSFARLKEYKCFNE